MEKLDELIQEQFGIVEKAIKNYVNAQREHEKGLVDYESHKIQMSKDVDFKSEGITTKDARDMFMDNMLSEEFNTILSLTAQKNVAKYMYSLENQRLDYLLLKLRKL